MWRNRYLEEDEPMSKGTRCTSLRQFGYDIGRSLGFWIASLTGERIVTLDGLCV